MFLNKPKTKSEKHLSAAHSFDEVSLFTPLYEGKDILNGKHANTTIPKIIGALNRYTVTNEEFYLKTAESFSTEFFSIINSFVSLHFCCVCLTK